MHPTSISIRTALANVFNITTRASSIHTPTLHNFRNVPSTTSHFSTTSSLHRKNPKAQKADRRITMIRYFLHHPTTLMPRPLRFSRNRALRHWTIHRAWQLFRANVKMSRTLELERQYNAMREANEELRVGAGDGGKLFRKAAMKTGIWSIPERGGGVPIEYSRGMVDWMGSRSLTGGEAKIWDAGWKRS